MPELVNTDYLKLFESSSIEHHVLSATFKELSNGKLLVVNRKWLLAIVFHVQMTLRMTISVIISGTEFNRVFIDLFQSFGPAVYFCNFTGNVTGLIAAAYLVLKQEDAYSVL